MCYSFFICCGHGLFILGAFFNEYWLMILGRVVQGSGAENLMITQYYTSHKFFENNYISMAMGLDMSLSFLASVVAFYMMPWLYLHTSNLNFVLLVSMVAPVASLAAAIYFVHMYSTDEKLENTILQINQESERESSVVLNLSDSDLNPLNEKPNEDPSKDQMIGNPYADDGTEKDKKKKFKCSDIKKFPIVFWLVAGIALMDSTAYYAFIGVSTKLISVKYSLSYDQAKNVPLVVPFVQMLLIPFLTKFTYHYGGKPIFLALSSVIGLVALFTFIFATSLSPYVGVVLFGLFFSFHLSSFWPCAAIASEPAHVDIGLGIVNTMQNLSSFLMPIFLGTRFTEITKDNADDYLKILVGMLSTGFFLSSALLFFDLRTGKNLIISEVKRKSSS